MGTGNADFRHFWWEELAIDGIVTNFVRLDIVSKYFAHHNEVRLLELELYAGHGEGGRDRSIKSKSKSTKQTDTHTLRYYQHSRPELSMDRELCQSMAGDAPNITSHGIYHSISHQLHTLPTWCRENTKNKGIS